MSPTSQKLCFLFDAAWVGPGLWPSHHVKMHLYSKQITKNMQSNQGRTKAPVQIIKKGQNTKFVKYTLDRRKKGCECQKEGRRGSLGIYPGPETVKKWCTEPQQGGTVRINNQPLSDMKTAFQ